MRVKARLQLLGTQVVQGRKDTTKFYNTVSFLDGIGAVNIMVDSLDVYNSLVQLPQMTSLDCVIDLNIGRYTHVRLISADVVEDKAGK